MSMSRKDYIAAAEVIAEAVKAAQDQTPARKQASMMSIREIQAGLATMFAMDNGRFDRHIFARACGLGDPVPVKFIERGDTYHYYGRVVKVEAVSGPLVNVYYTSGWNSGKDNLFTVSPKELQR